MIPELVGCCFANHDADGHAHRDLQEDHQASGEPHAASSPTWWQPIGHILHYTLSIPSQNTCALAPSPVSPSSRLRRSYPHSTFDKKAEGTMLVTSNEAMDCMRNQLALIGFNPRDRLVALVFLCIEDYDLWKTEWRPRRGDGPQMVRPKAPSRQGCGGTRRRLRCTEDRVSLWQPGGRVWPVESSARCAGIPRD